MYVECRSTLVEEMLTLQKRVSRLTGLVEASPADTELTAGGDCAVVVGASGSR